MTTSIVEALADGPAAARLALAYRLAMLVDDEQAPAYTVVQAARALGTLLTAMLEEGDQADHADLHTRARRILDAVA